MRAPVGSRSRLRRTKSCGDEELKRGRLGQASIQQFVLLLRLLVRSDERTCWVSSRDGSEQSDKVRKRSASCSSSFSIPIHLGSSRFAKQGADTDTRLRQLIRRPSWHDGTATRHTLSSHFPALSPAHLSCSPSPPCSASPQFVSAYQLYRLFPSSQASRHGSCSSFPSSAGSTTPLRF